MKMPMPEKQPEPKKSLVLSWRDFPHRVKAVEAASKQRRYTREEQLAQQKRNDQQLARMKQSLTEETEIVTNVEAPPGGDNA